ncbi:MAG: hypothetical protein AAB740_04340 [Patescibacteria group bacterium]
MQKNLIIVLVVVIVALSGILIWQNLGSKTPVENNQPPISDETTGWKTYKDNENNTSSVNNQPQGDNNSQTNQEDLKKLLLINVVSPANSDKWQENNSYNIQWTIVDSLKEKVQKVLNTPDSFASLAVRTVGAEPCDQQSWCINGKVIPGDKVAEYSITTFSLSDFLSGNYAWKIPSNYSGYLVQPVYIQIYLKYSDGNGEHREYAYSKPFTIIK